MERAARVSARRQRNRITSSMRRWTRSIRTRGRRVKRRMMRQVLTATGSIETQIVKDMTTKPKRRKSQSDVRSIDFADGFRAVTSWIDRPGDRGPALSVFWRTQELLRVDLFDEGAHAHYGLAQTRARPGPTARVFIAPWSMDDRPKRARFEFEHNLMVCLRTHPDRRLRNRQIDPAELKPVAEWIENEMRSIENAAAKRVGATTTEAEAPKRVGSTTGTGARATIMIPTTGDRGPLLPLCVGSALAQTIDDVEIFIVGDGVDPPTRRTAERLCREDDRVHFFDFPKHARRGEPNRHLVLTEHARGNIVAYVCDRDLLLPEHVQELERILVESDFAHTLRFRVDEDDTFGFRHTHDLRDDDVRSRAERLKMLLPLSFAGHTMEMYRRLPYGWRETPPDQTTDGYMWRQFFADPTCRVGSSPIPTVLTFKRGDHPGWSTDQRREVMVRWRDRITAEGSAAIQRGVLDALWYEWKHLERTNRRSRRRAVAAVETE